jgi:glycosyltransferase involved in cell wall biosynthesis
VVNDCSTDGTALVLSGYAGRVLVLENERNSGIAKTYNRAIAESSGDILLLLASDCELVATNYLSRLVGHFDDPAQSAR